MLSPYCGSSACFRSETLPHRSAKYVTTPYVVQPLSKGGANPSNPPSSSLDKCDHSGAWYVLRGVPFHPMSPANFLLSFSLILLAREFVPISCWPGRGAPIHPRGQLTFDVSSVLLLVNGYHDQPPPIVPRGRYPEIHVASAPFLHLMPPYIRSTCMEYFVHICILSSSVACICLYHTAYSIPCFPFRVITLCCNRPMRMVTQGMSDRAKYRESYAPYGV